MGAPFLSVCKIADAITTGISFSKNPSPYPASHFLYLKIEIPPLYRKLNVSHKKRRYSASRPYGDNAWEGKPVAMMGASIGMLGTARAQYHLRQSCVFLNMFPPNQPEVMIANAGQKFDQDGNLTDQQTRGKIGELLQALVVWTRRLQVEKRG